jgi:predicted tellurium resistance membrane protein TerC
LENVGQNEEGRAVRTSFAGVATQIMLLDIVFSLDSVITAVGMANSLWVMAAAIIIAVAIMLAASRPLADFVERHPTVKMLALSFLLLIGMTLIADGAGFDVPKGYIYAAIGFSVAVETLNQLAARRRR